VIVCQKCNASLSDGTSFCTSCGTKLGNSAVAGSPSAECAVCHAVIAPGLRFCTACGAPVNAPAATSWASVTAPVGAPINAAAPSNVSFSAPISAVEVPPLGSPAASNAATFTPVNPALASGTGFDPAIVVANGAPAFTPVNNLANGGATSAPKQGSPLLKIAVAGFIVLVLLIGGSVAGVMYLVHRAKQKAAEIESEYGIEKALKRLDDAAAAQNAKGSGSSHGSNHAVERSGGGTSPAASPLPDVKPAPVVPAVASGNQAHDWALQYERTEGSAEADLVVRAGDINNLGFGWPPGFDPFSGKSTPNHSYPWKTPDGVADGTDRIMVGTSVDPHRESGAGDGYSSVLNNCNPFGTPGTPCQGRQDSMPRPISLPVGALPAKIDAVLVQIFVDDFQAPVWHSHFQVSVNGTRIPNFEDSINALDQTGPVGKLISLRLLPEYWPLLQSGTVKLLIDDPTTHMRDGYAVDFVRILVNPHTFKYQVSLDVRVLDADTHNPIAGAAVTAALQSAQTDKLGKCELRGLPAGLVIAGAGFPGYDENSVQVDLEAGQTGTTDVLLHRHKEDTAALEKAIAQTGTATLYGIHFDTGSSKLRPDSMSALQAVLDLINHQPGANWVIAGHTDNQGSDATNMPLSQARAASVIAWLSAHGVDSSHLQPRGFGASRPVADNATTNGRALNRRVELSLGGSNSPR